MQTQNFQISQKRGVVRRQNANSPKTESNLIKKTIKKTPPIFQNELSYQEKQNRYHVNQLQKNPIFQIREREKVNYIPAAEWIY